MVESKKRSHITILPSFKEGVITLLMCCLRKALKIKASENGSQAFFDPDTKNFLIDSPSLVPPGSLVVTTSYFLLIR